ncbi:MAG: hypothetical protein AAF802_16545 [Planctomycetota bacterium]
MFTKLTASIAAMFVIATYLHAQPSTTSTNQDGTTSMKLIEQAETDIVQERYDEALDSLRQAIQLVPGNPDYQYKLATTLLAADRMPEMWQVLHKAATKHPNHADLARGLLSYWRMFDEQGLFNCEKETIDTVIRVLGEPDQLAKGMNRDRYIWGFIAVEVEHGEKTIHQTVDLRGLTPEHLQPVDFVRVDLDGRGRTVGHRTTNQSTTTAEFVLPGEQVQAWSELFSIQRIHGMARRDATLEQIADGMMASLAKTNTQRRYRMLDVSEDSVTFEWTAPATDQHQSQHELVRLMKGDIDVHRLAYVVKGTTEMDEELRQEWLTILASAKLELVNGSRPKNDVESDSQSAIEIGTHTANKQAWSQPDQLAWKFGEHLSLFVFAHAQENGELARPHLIEAARLSRKLGFQMPKPFQLSGDATANVVRAIGYLNEDTLGEMHRQKMPQSQIAVFEVASRLNVLAMVCSNEDLTHQSMFMIRQAIERSRLPIGLIAPLNERVKLGGKPEEVRTVIRKIQADVAVLFQRQPTEEEIRPITAVNGTVSTQELYMNGSNLGEITPDGEVWIGGDKAGDITKDGEVWVAGNKEGEITEDGEVWHAGNQIGEITNEGEIWRDGEQTGSIEENGDVWLEGSNIGNAKGGSTRDAALVLFFDFFDLASQ